MPYISLIAGPQDHEVKAADVTWEQWSKALHEVVRTPCAPCPGHGCEAKQGRAWIPARFHGPRVVDSDVTAVTFAVFDLDAPTREQLADIAHSLDGFAYLAHETHAGDSYRLVLPLTEEVPAIEWPAVWDAIVKRFDLPADITCRNLSRLYFCPSKPEGADFKIFTGEGKHLAWRELDLTFGGGSPIAAFQQATHAAASALVEPVNLREGLIDLEEMRRTIAALRKPESRAMLDTILAGRRLTEGFPGDVGFRDSALIKACALLATAPQGRPYSADSVVALLHGSIRAMDTEPEGLDHWLNLAKQKYLRKVAERLERDQMRDSDKASILRVLGFGEKPESLEGWRKDLIWGPKDKDGNATGLRQTGSNAGVIFQCAPDFKGAIRFNALTRDIEVSSGPLQGRPSASLDVEAKNWLAHSEFQLHINTFEIREQLLAVARRQEFDPLREWVEKLPPHDGVARVEDFFELHMVAQGPREYLKAISRCFLISCIARAMEPGCEVQNAPILVGEQGCGKSRSLKALGQPFFTDSKITMGDKDSQILISGHWIVELAELAGWRAVDNETIKGFISRSTDKFRPPYGHTMESFLRRCVFVGTTNEEEMLSDPTGNRRWWPVKVGQINVDAVARDRDQLFAEALVMYRAGRQWHLTPAEASLAKTHAEAFLTTGGARAEQIVAWFAAKPPAERPTCLSIFELMSNVFAIPSAQLSRALQMEGARALRDLGFVKGRKRIAGKPQWMYETPAELLQLAHNARPSHVALVKDETK